MSKTRNIAIALFFLNAAAAVLVASGVAADWGIQPQAGGDEAIDSANETANNLNPGQGSDQNLGGLFLDAGRTLKDVFGVVFAAPGMLHNLGVPMWLTTFIFAPMYLVVAMDMYYAFTGRRI